MKPSEAKIQRYRKTKRGYVVRKYLGMSQRVRGLVSKKHLYAGKEILSKEDFYKWAETSEEFERLFRNWEMSGYERRLAPSVDRTDPALGYQLGNIEWVTQSENSRRGSISRHKQ